MTASNVVLEGMANTREAAILSAAVEAITWKHCLEPDEGPRKGQRVVGYLKEITQLEEALNTGDPNVDSEDGHPIAYAHLLQAAQSYEHPHVFLREDSEQITSKVDIAAKVPVWMNTAAQVATRNRKMVLEDGPDKMNSDNDDALYDEREDELTGVSTSEMDPKKGPVMLSQAQVAAQKAAAQMLKSLKAPPSSHSPISGNSDEDDPNAPEFVWSQTKSCMRPNKYFRKRVPTVESKIETSIPVPAPHKSTPVNSDKEDQEEMTEDQKRYLNQGKWKGAKAATRYAVDSGNAHPMETRGKASRAGGLRGVTGSGHPSKT
jgi:hypothetical protein